VSLSVLARWRDPLLGVATLGIAAVWLALAFVDWSNLVGGSSLGSPWGQYYGALVQYGDALLFAPGAHAAPIAAILVFNVAAAVIGHSFIVVPIWGRGKASEMTLVLAGVIPGTLLVIAVTRVVTLLLPHSVAPWIIWALVAAAAIFALTRGDAPRIGSRALPWSHVGALAAALAAALVFQIHFDGFHVSGESSLWLYGAVFMSDSNGLGTDARLPLISQHYDEAAFLYAPSFAFMGAGQGALSTLMIMHWLCLAIGRLGMACLVYVGVRGLKVDRLSAIVCVAFVFAASLSLNPASSSLLFDSSSPLGYGLHMARVLAPVLPFLILSAAVNLTGAAPRRAYAVAALLGLGLATLPIHLAVVLPFAVLLLGLTALNPAASASLNMWRAACVAAVACLFAFSIAYGLQLSPVWAPDWGRAIGMMVSAAVPALLMAVLAFVTRGRTPPEKADGTAISIGITVCVGYFVGVTLLGNFAISAIAPHLEGIWPWQGMPVLERLEATTVVPALELAQSPYCDGVWTWRNHIPASHCGSLPIFVRTYGLVFVAIAAVLGWYLLRRSREPRSTGANDRTYTLFLWALASCLFALPFAFTVYDFVATQTADRLSIWLRSRLVEPWFISGILIAASLFFREAGVRARRWAQTFMLASIALFVLNPLVFAGQWITNVFYVIDALLLN